MAGMIAMRSLHAGTGELVSNRVLIAASAVLAMFLMNGPSQAAPASEESITVRVLGVHRGGTERGAFGAECGLEARSLDGSRIYVECEASTVLHPTGARIKWGEKIKVVGHWVGTDFFAREITILEYMN